jgi:hypothetical protein
MKIRYQPMGSGVAGHVQPAIHFHWNTSLEIRGIDSDVCKWDDENMWPVREWIRFNLPPQAKELGVFYQGDSPGWLMLEFWTRQESRVKLEVLDFYTKRLEEYLDSPVEFSTPR